MSEFKEFKREIRYITTLKKIRLLYQREKVYQRDG